MPPWSYFTARLLYESSCLISRPPFLRNAVSLHLPPHITIIITIIIIINPLFPGAPLLMDELVCCSSRTGTPLLPLCYSGGHVNAVCARSEKHMFQYTHACISLSHCLYDYSMHAVINRVTLLAFVLKAPQRAESEALQMQ